MTKVNSQMFSPASGGVKGLDSGNSEKKCPACTGHLVLQVANKEVLISLTESCKKQ